MVLDDHFISLYSLIRLLIILPFLTEAAFGQVDSLAHPAVTLTSALNHTLDSVEWSFNNQADSLKQSYGEATGKIESLKNGYQQKIDSLKNLKLSAEKYTLWIKEEFYEIKCY